MARTSAQEQRAHIDEGDYVWCENCGGSGGGNDGPWNWVCGDCDGDGIVFCGDDPAINGQKEIG